MIIKELQGLKDVLYEIQAHQVDKIKECFKSNICFEVRFNLYFCVKCGQMAGCFLCCYRLLVCPLCRGAFPPKQERVPQFVPQLSEICGGDDISLADIRSQIQAEVLVASDEENGDNL